MQTLKHQYQLIKTSREIVFTYCESMQPQHYMGQVENFGRGGTMRHIHSHIANTYLFWLDMFAQNNSPAYTNGDDITSVQQIREAFDVVNKVVDDFLQTFEHSLFDKITTHIPSINKEMSIEPISLFTHVITHECHHKGQLMTMGRIQGYTPPDADLIPFG